MTEAAQPKPRHYRTPLIGAGLTVALISLVIFVTHPMAGDLSFLMVGAILAALVACYTLLPGSIFFMLALANLIAVYACFYIVILDSHFQEVELLWQSLGFLAPLLAFFCGALWQRREIRSTIKAHLGTPGSDYAHALLWLVAIAAVGLVAMIYAGSVRELWELRLMFLSAMGLTSVIVLWASRDLTLFMLDTGLLFESIFRRAAHLIAPIFAFFTLYSMVVLVFGSIYAAIDMLTEDTHFRILGAAQTITFPEALYYSVATLATVGYGDIVPTSNIIRMLSAFEVICGVALLLFGFNEIMTLTREHRSRHSKEHPPQ